MSTTISRRIIRLKLDIAKKTSERFADVLTNGTPELWKGNDVEFQIGIFQNAVAVTDVSTLASITLIVRQTNSVGALLMTATLATASLTNCTDAAWTAGTGQHASITFTGQEANVAAGTHWLCVGVVTTDAPGRSVTLGATTLAIAEDGIGSEADAQAVDGTAWTKEEADARYIPQHADLAFWQFRSGTPYGYEASTDKWYPLVVTIVDTIPVLTLGPGETL